MLILIYNFAPQRLKFADATSIARRVNKTNGIDAGAEQTFDVHCSRDPCCGFEDCLHDFLRSREVHVNAVAVKWLDHARKLCVYAVCNTCPVCLGADSLCCLHLD